MLLKEFSDTAVFKQNITSLVMISCFATDGLENDFAPSLVTQEWFA